RATAARSSPGGRGRSRGWLRGSAASSRPGSCTAAGGLEQRGQHAWKLVCEPRLAHVVVGAGLPDLEYALLVVVTAHGHDREIGRGLAQAPGRLDAVEDRHLD